MSAELSFTTWRALADSVKDSHPRSQCQLLCVANLGCRQCATCERGRYSADSQVVYRKKTSTCAHMSPLSSHERTVSKFVLIPIQRNGWFADTLFAMLPKVEGFNYVPCQLSSAFAQYLSLVQKQLAWLARHTQWCRMWEPVLFRIDNWCSLRRSFRRLSEVVNPPPAF